MAKLLKDTKSILLITELAEVIGLNEALFIQQLHYWIEINKESTNHATFDMWKKHKQDDKWWVWNTPEEWKKKDFPFWSERTIERIIEKLRKRNLIIIGRYNAKKYDKTNWYTINYDELTKVEDMIVKLKAEKALKEEISAEEKKERELFKKAHKKKRLASVTCMDTHTDKVSEDFDNVASPIPKITSEISKNIKIKVCYESDPVRKQEPKTNPTDRLSIIFEQCELNAYDNNPNVKLSLEDAIRDMYTNSFSANILNKGKAPVGLTHQQIKERLELLRIEHVTRADFNYKKANHITNPKVYLQKCLLSAIVEHGIEEQRLLDSVEDGYIFDNSCKSKYTKANELINFDQRDIPEDGYDKYLYKVNKAI